MLFFLSRYPGTAVTEIAGALGMTHPSVNEITSAMENRGLLISRKDPVDERRRLVSLSPSGGEMVTRLKPAWEKIRIETEGLIAESETDLLAALDALEDALDRENIFDRVMTAMNRSNIHTGEADDVKIVDYQPEYDDVFRRLNTEWLEEYFAVEPEDEAVLKDPYTSIISRGGDIFFARWRDRIVGTVALLPAGDGAFELAKMGVTAEVRGKGIGRILGHEAISRARSRGAPALELLTNPLLHAACALYRSLGFVEVEKTGEEAGRYERETIRMKLSLD